jgi:hypothetical protein
MKKTLLAQLSIAIAITAIAPAQAQDQKVLAIIDTAIDSNKVTSVIHEVCFTTAVNQACSNGQLFMEGKGAAAIKAWPKSRLHPVYHGHNMTQVALTADPTVKIVFIRYAELNTIGNYGNFADSLVRAIDWVSKNSEKYSIDALSISQSGMNIPTWCAGNKTTVDAVALLNSKNVPVFAATGNNANANAIGFPSCVSGVVGVGALQPNKTAFERATNGQSKVNPGIDLATFGAVEIQKGKTIATFPLAGSSGATVVAASKYLKNNTSKTFQEYFNALPKITINTVTYSSN